MKPKNFPARKLRRKLNADAQNKIFHPNGLTKIREAREIRTKKYRGGRS